MPLRARRKQPRLSAITILFALTCFSHSAVAQRDCFKVHSPPRNGVPVAAVDCGFKVAASAEGMVDSDLAIKILFFNDTSSPLEVGARNISASQKGRSIAVLTREEMISNIRRRDSGARFLSGLASIVDAVGTGMSAGRERTTGNVSGYSDSGDYFSGVYSATTINERERRAAMNGVVQRSDAMQTEITESQEQAINTVNQLYLHDTYLPPGKKTRGVFIVKPRYPNVPITLHVRLGSRTAELVIP